MSDTRSMSSEEKRAAAVDLQKQEGKGGERQVAQQPQPSGQVQAQQPQAQWPAVQPWYDPFAMRLGLGDWFGSDFGLLGPSLLDMPFSTMLEPFAAFPRTGAFMNDMIRVPTLDLNETSRGYELQVDLPGVPKENIKVDLTGRTLTVSAERKEERVGDERTGYSRSFGKFYRSLVLPRNSDIEKIDAKYEHGQLKVLVPKQPKAVQEARPIRIQ